MRRQQCRDHRVLVVGGLGRVFSKGGEGEGRVELAAKEEDRSPLHGSYASMHGASCTHAWSFMYAEKE